MRATEFIQKLQALVDSHGDLECLDAYNDQIGDPEVAEGSPDEPPAFVLADKA